MQPFVFFQLHHDLKEMVGRRFNTVVQVINLSLLGVYSLLQLLLFPLAGSLLTRLATYEQKHT